MFNRVTRYRNRKYVLFTVAAFFFVLFIIGAGPFLRLLTHSSICRGIECLEFESKSGNRDREEIILHNMCVYIGGPTGIGIFSSVPYGSLVRSFLAMKYILFSTEYLFVYNDGNKIQKIILLNTNEYHIDLVADNDNVCSATMKFEYLPLGKKITIIVSE